MNGLLRFIVGIVITALPLTALAQDSGSQQDAGGQQPTHTQQKAATTKTPPVDTLNLAVGRIAVINTGAFAAQNGLAQLRQQIERVNEMFKDRNAELQALRQRAEALQRELQTQRSNLTPQSLAAKQGELEELQVKVQRKKEDLERDFKKAMREATDPVLERVEAFLRTYAKQHHITLVLEAAVLSQARGLAYVDPGLDITRAFIDAYNAANPVTTASSNSSPVNH